MADTRSRPSWGRVYLRTKALRPRQQEVTINRTSKAAYAVLLTVALVPPALLGCGRGTKPGAAPAPTPSASVAEPSPSQSATSPAPVPAPTTAPSAGTTVVSARLAYQWHWPNDASRPGTVTHTYRVPPVPQLVRIGVGDHPSELGERPYNRMSFTLTTGFPTYEIQFVDQLVGDPTGLPIALDGQGVLRVIFREAQAHSVDGTRSSIVAKPAPHLGLTRMASYALAGDHEGVLTYGIGIAWPSVHANPQIAVRDYEVTTVTRQGTRQYVVAIDVDASPLS